MSVDKIGFPNPFDEFITDDVPIDSCVVCGRPVIRKTIDAGYSEHGVEISPLYSMNTTCEPGHSFVSLLGTGEKV